MDYLTAQQGSKQTGLRLVLTRGVPGPWSEAAKAVFRWHNVEFTPVEQISGRSNAELIDWTGHRNAPIAVLDDEPPRVRWQEILDLAERLGGGPSLYPTDIQQRIQAVGIASEVCNEGGVAWHGRMLMLDAIRLNYGDVVLVKNPLFREYGFSQAAVKASALRVEQTLSFLASTIHSQRAKGSEYLVGETLSLADVYWTYFSNLLKPLPTDVNPMPTDFRETWEAIAKGISGYDPVLIDYRDAMFDEHFTLPLEF